jgi:hypothetical protein
MAMSRGCTIALIIVAAILLIIIIGLIIVYVNRDKIVEAGVDYMIENAEEKIIANLPDGYTPEMVQELMRELKAAIKNDQIPGSQLQEMIGVYRDMMDDNEITKEEGTRLLGMIEDALGREPSPDESMPVDSLPDSLQVVPDSA